MAAASSWFRLRELGKLKGHVEVGLSTRRRSTSRLSSSLYTVGWYGLTWLPLQLQLLGSFSLFFEVAISSTTSAMAPPLLGSGWGNLISSRDMWNLVCQLEGARHRDGPAVRTRCDDLGFHECISYNYLDAIVVVIELQWWCRLFFEVS